MTQKSTRNSLLAVLVVFALGIVLPAVRSDEAYTGAQGLEQAPDIMTTSQPVDAGDQPEQQSGEGALAALPTVG